MRGRRDTVVRLALIDASGNVVHDTHRIVEVFPPSRKGIEKSVLVIGQECGPASKLARELGLRTTDTIEHAQVILIDDYKAFARKRKSIMCAAATGANVVFLELPSGEYEICDTDVRVEACGMGERHFVSRDTGHPLVGGLRTGDFSFWFDPELDRIAPILSATFDAEGWQGILSAGNGDWSSGWHPSHAAAERVHGKGRVYICQIRLAGRTQTNPIAREFASSIVLTGSA